MTSFVNVQFNFPAVILLSRVDEWWNYIDDCDQHTIVSTLEDIHAGLPILTIASCKADIPTRVSRKFKNSLIFINYMKSKNFKFIGYHRPKLIKRPKLSVAQFLLQQQHNSHKDRRPERERT